MRNIARETQIRKPFGKTDSSIGFQPAVWISSRRSIAPREPVKGADREVEIRTYHSWAHFRELIPAWEGILRENGALSIFSTPEWLGSWWDAFGTNRQLIALTFWDADGELLGLAPLYLDESRLSPFNKKKCLRLVGDGSGDSDNLDLILRPGFEVVCCQAFLRWLVDHPRWDVCCLNTMPENSMGARVLSRQLTASKWTLSHTASPNGALSLPSSWESYVESLACDFRPLVTRYPHRLTKRFQERVYRCEDASQLSTGLDVLFSLHQNDGIRLASLAVLLP